MSVLIGRPIVVHGRLAHLPEGSISSIPPRSLYFESFAIDADNNNQKD